MVGNVYKLRRKGKTERERVRRGGGRGGAGEGATGDSERTVSAESR